MSFLKNIFGKKEGDPEILRLEELTKTKKDVPDPQIELAVAYLARVRTPPNWNDDDAKRAVNAFRKAGAIAKKHAPAQARSIQDRFVETAHEIATTYYTYHDTQPELKWLEASIWLLEQALSDLKGSAVSVDRIATLIGAKAEPPPDKKQQSQIITIREGLYTCWLKIAAWYEAKLENESEGEDCLNKHITATERATSYTDDDNARTMLNYGIARNQIVIGARYAERAAQSKVVSRQGGNLLNIDDHEHKEYARQAIRILRAGLERLRKYPNSKDYEQVLAGANDALASAYYNLYILTWAHSKMSQSIGILQEGVQVVPNDACLWHTLGKAYEHLADEVIDETNKKLGRSETAASILGIKNTGYNIGVKVEIAQAESKAKGLMKESAQCYLKARELAPDQY